MNFKRTVHFFNSLLLLWLTVAYSVYGQSAHENSELWPLPIKSEQLSHYYIKDNHPDISDLYLRPEYQKQTNKFSSQEITIPVKGIHWGKNSVDSSIAYYEISHFDIDGYRYKLIIYNSYGEADTPLLNIQLNSYNSDGVLLDALLLDSRFSYEDINSYKLFTIAKDHSITINNYVTYLADYDVEGEPKIIENPKPQLYHKAIYQIHNGIFQLVSEKEYQMQVP